VKRGRQSGSALHTSGWRFDTVRTHRPKDAISEHVVRTFITAIEVVNLDDDAEATKVDHVKAKLARLDVPLDAGLLIVRKALRDCGLHVDTDVLKAVVHSRQASASAAKLIGSTK
jgi:hypothetical protein